METNIKCPYCRGSIVADAATCLHCQEPLPWASEIARLQEQLKERETSRLRATFTLVDELMGASKSGKPVSMAAIKGFITSWLFPRTVIILGSLLGGAVLVAQTVILYNQTNLLDTQAKAAQIEQEGKLRERIANLSNFAIAAKLIHTIYSEEGPEAPCAEGDNGCLNRVIFQTNTFEWYEPLAEHYAAVMKDQIYRMRVESRDKELVARITGATDLSAINAYLESLTSACQMEPEAASSLVWSLALFDDNRKRMNEAIAAQKRESTQFGAVHAALKDYGKFSTEPSRNPVKIGDFYKHADYQRDRVAKTLKPLVDACELELAEARADHNLMRLRPRQEASAESPTKAKR